MPKLSRIIDLAVARGDKITNTFSGTTRISEYNGFLVGDTFTLPNTYVVYTRKFGDYETQYILVQTGEDEWKEFYPSTFRKNRAEYTESLTPTGKRFRTLGTATELFNQHESIQLGMEALAGKTLTISAIKMIRTIDYNRPEQLIYTQILTIDIVE